VRTSHPQPEEDADGEPAARGTAKPDCWIAVGCSQVPVGFVALSRTKVCLYVRIAAELKTL
jgi:hypothetical protein